MIAIAVISALTVIGQDLGSANKLFGTPAKKTTAKPKTTTSKQKSAAKKTTPSSTPAKSTPSDDKSGAADKPTKTSAANDALFEELIDKGNAARDDRDYATAEAAYKRAKDLKPRDWRAVYGQGNLYADQQRWEEAEAAYRAALQIDPSNATCHIALSYVLTQPVAAPDLSDRYAEAERLARRAIQLEASNALAFDQLGVSMELRGLIGAETEGAYRRAIELDKTFAPAYAHLGRLLRRRGMVKESADSYKQAILLASDAASMIIVADIMQSELRFSESEPLLTKAIVADPKNPSALLLLGRAQTTLGKFADAEQTLKKCLAVSPASFVPNSMLATLYFRQARLDAAEGALMQALRTVSTLEKRQLSRQFSMLGEAYLKAGDAAGAQRVNKQAKMLDGENRSVAGK